DPFSFSHISNTECRMQNAEGKTVRFFVLHSAFCILHSSLMSVEPGDARRLFALMQPRGDFTGFRAQLLDQLALVAQGLGHVAGDGRIDRLQLLSDAFFQPATEFAAYRRPAQW